MQQILPSWFPLGTTPVVTYRLALPPSAVLDRISRAVEDDQETGRSLAQRGEFLGHVWGNRFRIWHNPTRGGVNSPFAPGMFGIVQAEGDGSQLAMGFKTRMFVRFFMVAWFASSGLFVVVALAVGLGQLASGSARPTDLLPLLALLLLPLLGLVLLKWGERQGRADELALRRLLEQIFAGAIVEKQSET